LISLEPKVLRYVHAYRLTRLSSKRARLTGTDLYVSADKVLAVVRVHIELDEGDTGDHGMRSHGAVIRGRRSKMPYVDIEAGTSREPERGRWGWTDGLHQRSA